LKKKKHQKHQNVHEKLREYRKHEQNKTKKQRKAKSNTKLENLLKTPVKSTRTNENPKETLNNHH
jgi:hypothetical protein